MAKSHSRAMSIDLFGHQLTVRSDNDPARVKEIVAFVNQRLESIQGTSKRAPTDKIALLCALNIAEELFSEREKRRALRERVTTDSKKLMQVVDQLEAVEAKGSAR